MTRPPARTGRARAAEPSRRAILAAAAAAVLCGCQPEVASHGRRHDVEASYQFRTLDARLGPEVSVLTAQAAAAQALRARGYVLTSQDGDNDHARVAGRSSGSGDWERVVVESRAVPGATLVSVTCEPFGDQSTSRAVLDAILNRLGR